MNLTTFLYCRIGENCIYIYRSFYLYGDQKKRFGIIRNTYMSHVRINTHRNLHSATSVLISQWLQRLTGDQKLKLRVRLPSGTKKHFP